MVRRRAVLGLLAIPAFPGCTSFLRSDVRLGGVWVSNHTDAPQTVHIRVSTDGGEVHSSTHELDALDRISETKARADASFVECDWPAEPGRFVIDARREGRDWYSFDLSDEADEGCHAVHLQIPLSLYEDVVFSTRPCPDSGERWRCDFVER